MEIDRPPSGMRDRARAWLVTVVLTLLQAALRPFGWGAAQRAGRWVGTAIWLYSRRDRQRALEHLAMAFPNLAAAERRQLARACFRHHGINLTECLHLLDHDCAYIASLIEVEGWQEIDKVRAAGRPLLLVTGHCGNWELLGAVYSCRGANMAVVARPLDEPNLQRTLAGFRAHFGTPTIERGSVGAVRKLLVTLRGGGALGMLIDQDTRVDGVWVPFFGRPAFTPVGAAKFALRRRAAVIPTFIERDESGRHRIRVLPPLELPPDLQQATALLTLVIEEQVRRRPEQWVWMHRRWRRQPPGPAPAHPAPASASQAAACTAAPAAGAPAAGRAR
ncbi:MAG TPA: lysophospholipid acyltransferase family protein [Thermoanaerobaculia bacterium]|nr:lysophospholipid acyltransferase family protein [Thermoanaerobaculia bacterium]